jgi:hypothetical protein
MKKLDVMLTYKLESVNMDDVDTDKLMKIKRILRISNIMYTANSDSSVQSSRNDDSTIQTDDTSFNSAEAKHDDP